MNYLQGPVIIVSKQGGVNIEDIAATNPEAISYTPINVMKGLTLKQLNKIVDDLGIQEEGRKITSSIICNLYELFIEKDALLLEINPFALDICGKCMSWKKRYFYRIFCQIENNNNKCYIFSDFALDCKCSFDDSSEFRQKKLFALQDFTQIDPNEVQASKFYLNYIALDGNIGCLVNGAGLAMATMDLIQRNGGMPANFLDVSGNATAESVKEAFKIIVSDPKVF